MKRQNNERRQKSRDMHKSMDNSKDRIDESDPNGIKLSLNLNSLAVEATEQQANSYRSSKGEDKLHKNESNKFGLGGQQKLRTIKNKKLTKQLLEGTNTNSGAEATRSQRNTNRNENSKNELH
jgi:hypothetical protein